MCGGQCVSAESYARSCGGSGGSAAAGGSAGASAGNGGGGAVTREAVPCEIVQRFSIHPPQGTDSVHLSGSMNGWSEPGEALTRADDGVYSVELALRPGEYVYKFVLDQSTWISDPGNPNVIEDGLGGVNSVVSVFAREDSTFDGDCETACFAGADFDWRDAVMYSVFIDRYVDSDGEGSEPSEDGDAQNPRWGWGGGDLAGLTSKLPYLADLGVSMIWLGPPQKAGDGGYHGYWPVRDDTDYSDPAAPSPVPAIEPRFGSAQELRDFVSSAHDTQSASGTGMKVLLDYVANHVHESSPLVAAHPDWFYLQDGEPLLCDGGTASAADDLWDDPYWGTRCTFSSFLWKFDYEASPAALEWSLADMRYWLQEYGFDAFRIDAARHQPVVWMERLREAMDQVRVSDDLEPYLMGETFSYDPAVVARDVDPEKRFDGQLDFPVRKHLCEALLSEKTTMATLAYELALGSTLHPDRSLMATWLGNHDIPRQIHYASGEIPECVTGSHEGNRQPFQFAQPDDDEAYQRLTLAFVALLTNPGLPVIYAGDEIGLAGGGDPENRRMMEWWEDALLPGQKKLRASVRELANLRGQNRALSRGARRTFFADDDTWIFERVGCGDASGFVIAIHRGPAQITRELPAGGYAGLAASDGAEWDGGDTITLSPQSFAVLRRE